MRKQIGLKFPEELIKVVDRVSGKQYKTRTMFIEEAVRDKLNNMRITINDNRVVKTWQGDVDDMPLHVKNM